MRRSVLAAFVLVACGPSTVPPPHHGETRPPPDDHTAVPPPATPPSRDLAPTATFADLVRAARGLDGTRAESSTRGCLVAASSLAADLAVPVRPLPAPWDDAAALLADRPGSVRVLSRWGTSGRDSTLAVAAFTTFPPPDPTRPTVVLFLGARGVSARSTESTASPAPVAIDDVPAGVPLLAGPLATVLVTADAAVPVATLRTLLARLASVAAPVGLAVPFPIGTHLPPDTVAAADRAALCPDGLADPVGSVADGELSRNDLVAVVTPLHDAVPPCFAGTTRAGDVAVTFRIGADGTVSAACATHDDIGSPAARACLLDAIRALHFASPQPAGRVMDVALPFHVTANTDALTQHPLCE